MNRRNFFAAFVAIAMGLVALIASSSDASAQVPIPQNCCTYTVDVDGFPDACFEFRVMTRWSSGIEAVSIPANGVYTFAITNANPCPPAPGLFAWASLDGGGTLAWFNFPATYNINGCCYVVRIGQDAAGCIIVYVRPC